MRIKRHFPRTFLCVVNMTDDAQPLAEQCGTSAHATEALLHIRQEQKIRHFLPMDGCSVPRIMGHVQGSDADIGSSPQV